MAQTGTSVSESDLGAPFYPGSAEIPNSGVKAMTEKGSTALSIRTTNDDGPKVMEFYTEKFGKPEKSVNSRDVTM